MRLHERLAMALLTLWVTHQHELDARGAGVAGVGGGQQLLEGRLHALLEAGVALEDGAVDGDGARALGLGGG